MDEVSGVPAWWPECPYPAEVFPMSLDRYPEIVPDGNLRGALSGAMGRFYWRMASDEILRCYREAVEGKD